MGHAAEHPLQRLDIFFCSNQVQESIDCLPPIDGLAVLPPFREWTTGLEPSFSQKAPNQSQFLGRFCDQTQLVALLVTLPSLTELPKADPLHRLGQQSS